MVKPVGWRGEPKRHSEAAKKGWNKRIRGWGVSRLERIRETAEVSFVFDLLEIRGKGQHIKRTYRLTKDQARELMEQIRVELSI